MTLVKRKWSLEEDKLLKQTIGELGEGNWDLLAAHVPNRTGKQCRERWLNYLSSEVTKEMWTHEEDNKLIQLVTERGARWSKISRQLPGRTDGAIKNRYVNLVRHQLAPKPVSFRRHSSSIQKSQSPQSSPQNPSCSLRESLQLQHPHPQQHSHSFSTGEPLHHQLLTHRLCVDWCIPSQVLAPKTLFSQMFPQVSPVHPEPTQLREHRQIQFNERQLAPEALPSIRCALEHDLTHNNFETQREGLGLLVSSKSSSPPIQAQAISHFLEASPFPQGPVADSQAGSASTQLPPLRFPCTPSLSPSSSY
eukprot:c2627_g1_i1.p1 GENE.c2627_g1_i1~~c2627_g1_i1.p1  ORF type:complete len:307 (+),score=55.75 c2627_g1_i1:275-1195(+)